MKQRLSVPLTALAFLPLLYILVPLLHLTSLTGTQDIHRILDDPTFMSALQTSFISATCTTIAAVMFGLPTAFWLSTYRFPGKWVIEAILLMPLIMPPLVGGISELGIYGPNTVIGGWARLHGIPLTDNLVAVVLAQAFITSPFLILAAKSGFDEVPTSLEEATRLMGGGVWTQFWHVSVPLARTAISVGVLLTFARAFGEFGATMLMAYHPYTVPVDIWVSFTSNGLTDIVPIAVVLLGISGIIVALTAWIPRSLRR